MVRSCEPVLLVCNGAPYIDVVTTYVDDMLGSDPTKGCGEFLVPALLEQERRRRIPCTAFRRNKRRLIRPMLALGVLATWACAPGDPPPRPGHDVRIAIVAAGLVVPWSIAVAPGGRLFVAERPGRIRTVVNDSLVNTPWAVVPAFDGTGHNWETGLMGLALDPDFSSRPFVYVCYTAQTSASTLVNRVARLRERDHRGEELTILLDDIPAGTYHNGCRVKVGPDRKLYVTTGDAYLKAPAQDVASLAGKVLRLNLDGSIPTDNPTPGSPVWSLGHRNPQGVAWDPRTGVGVLTEHGDSITDEINVLERGANYGWPDVQGRAGDPRFKDPALVFHVAPTGAIFLPESAPSAVHQMLITTLSGRLIRLAVDGTKVSVTDDSVLVGYGRLRDVAAGPDGSVYVATSNRDGRGHPRRGDDRILRVWLRGAPSGAVAHGSTHADIGLRHMKSPRSQLE